MNPRQFLPLLVAAALTPTLRASAEPAAKVGIYDSRVVAYAYFFQPARQAQLKQLIASAKAAQAAGDIARYEELKRQIAAEQQALHLQVFSTAPIPATLSQLSARLVEIEREVGVSRIISKWDEEALRGVATADRVDVTDLLVRDCELNDQQRRTMREIAGKEPLPLVKARELAAAGKL